MTQPKITILFKGKRVGMGLHSPTPPLFSSSTAFDQTVKPANDDVRTKDDRHSVVDVRKRLRDDHHHGDRDEQQPPIKKKKPSATAFGPGQRVEVRSDEKGFEGAWFAATVVGVLGEDRYIVKYRTLLTEDEERLLREKTSSRYMRPLPPRFRERALEIKDKVEAWYNDGWWEGEIATRLGDRKWGVYFKTSDEELVFSQSDLRLRLIWVNHRWVRPSSKTTNTAGIVSKKINMDRTRFHMADLAKRLITV